MYIYNEKIRDYGGKMTIEDQTKKAFAEKWENNSQFGYLDILDPASEITQWILNRNGWENYEALSKFLKSHSNILDAGCGNGRVTALFAELAPDNKITGFDVNPKVAQTNLAANSNITIEFHDLMKLSGKKFDFIYSQEVLHHVADPVLAFNHLVDSLNVNGTIAIYVYKKKAPIREYTDEFLRDQLAELDYESAIKLMNQISKFGASLSKLKDEVQIDSVELLGIPKGSYSVQRIFYHFFFKCFWNEGLTEAENDAINFDWYSPQIATKHTLEEVTTWFEDRNLVISHRFEDQYGITMHGTKK